MYVYSELVGVRQIALPSLVGSPSSRADAVVGVICHGRAALGGESLRRRRRVNVRGGGGKGLVAAAKEEEGSLSPFSPFPGMIGIHTPPGKRGRKCRAGERSVVATRYYRTVSNKRGGGVFPSIV